MLLPIPWPHVNPGLSSLVAVITAYLLGGTGSAHAQFTTPCEPVFMVICNLYFVYGLHPYKKMVLFLSVDFWVFTDVTCIGILKWIWGGLNTSQKRYCFSLVNPTPTKKKNKNNVVDNISDSNLGALAPHKTVALRLQLRTTYIFLVFLYSFIPLIPLKNGAFHWLINVYARTVKKQLF